jgi:putative membrane protein
MNSRLKTLIIFATATLLITTLSPLAQAQAPTDPQIVGIVVAANQIDIDHAKIALAKSKSKEVRDFAQQMITDHSAVQKSVFDLGAKLKVTPADSDTSKSLKDGAAKTTKELHSLKGKAFDDAYIKNEVGYHKAVIDALNTTLIPNAKNSELKGALTGVLPAFQGHMEHAQKLQTELQARK